MDNSQTITEKTKKIEIALKYTNGDMEKAKLMAMGSIVDVLAIKGKFLVEDQNKSGVFLAFFNVIDEYISAIKSLIEPSDTTFTKTRIFDNWRIIYKDILNYKNEKDVSSSEKLNEGINNAFVQVDVFPFVQKEDLDKLSSILLNVLKESFDSLNINCQIELEKTNSMELELAGIDIMLPFDINERQESIEPQIIFDPDSPIGKKIATIESQAQYVVNGNFVISPVKGKLLSEIKPNERVYILLSTKNPISRKILDTYKSRDADGNPLPFIGKIISVIHNEMNKGYIIHVLVAKGIYAKIIEEENLRIQTEVSAIDIKHDDEAAAKKKRLTKILYLVMYGVLVLLMIALLVTLVLI